jgi:hypothetical protein
MAFEGAEVHDGTVLEERRHAVADAFLGLRRSLPNSGTHCVKHGLDAGREALDVLIDRGRNGVHSSPLAVEFGLARGQGDLPQCFGA